MATRPRRATPRDLANHIPLLPERVLLGLVVFRPLQFFLQTSVARPAPPHRRAAAQRACVSPSPPREEENPRRWGHFKSASILPHPRSLRRGSDRRGLLRSSPSGAARGRRAHSAEGCGAGSSLAPGDARRRPLRRGLQVPACPAPPAAPGRRSGLGPGPSA